MLPWEGFGAAVTDCLIAHCKFLFPAVIHPECDKSNSLLQYKIVLPRLLKDGRDIHVGWNGAYKRVLLPESI